jgi:hypothetical protein
MAESFLEEQLKRMREMSEQMSRASGHAAELSNELERDRASRQRGPLYDVRDLRTYPPRKEEPAEQSDDHAGHARRHATRGPSRRRR